MKWNKYGWKYAQWTGELFHPGVDKNYGSGFDDFGFEVKPIAEGRVVFSDFVSNGWGNMIWIEHHLKLTDLQVQDFRMNPQLKRIPVKNNIIKLWSRYGHLKDRMVEVGDVVNHETIIGHVGGTGHGSEDKQTWSPHLHESAWFVKVPFTGYVKGWTKQKVMSHTVNPEALVAQAKEWEKTKDTPSEWALDAIERNVEREIMSAERPHEPMTREEAHVLIDNTINFLQS